MFNGPVSFATKSSRWEVIPTAFTAVSREVESKSTWAAEVLHARITYITGSA